MEDFLIRHILIVEDDAEYRMMIQRYLENIGYTCEVAPDAFEALNRINRKSFDLVISDIKMTGKDGLELMREVKEHSPNLDFIIMSGYVPEFSYCDIIGAGAADFIVKPFEIEKLRAKLDRLEREKRVIQNLRTTHEKLSEASNYLENILANSAAAISIFDRHGKTVRWNKSSEEILGYSLDELKDRKFYELYADKQELSKMLAQLRSQGFVRQYDIDLKHKDGQAIPANVSISLLKNEEGTVIGSVGVAMDMRDLKKAMTELMDANEKLTEEITERKQVEEELQKARQELEDLVKERTAKLQKAGDMIRRSMSRMKEISEE